jgi:hypothetical protein
MIRLSSKNSTSTTTLSLWIHSGNMCSVHSSLRNSSNAIIIYCCRRCCRRYRSDSLTAILLLALGLIAYDYYSAVVITSESAGITRGAKKNIINGIPMNTNSKPKTTPKTIFNFLPISCFSYLLVTLTEFMIFKGSCITSGRFSKLMPCIGIFEPLGSGFSADCSNYYRFFSHISLSLSLSLHPTLSLLSRGGKKDT